MKQTLEAIYEKGVFRPLKAPQIKEGKQVRLTVDTPAPSSANDLLGLAASVYQGLTDKQIDEVERTALDRRGFFQR
ncbi:MAG: antitoxin family protein [bacterium]